VLPDPIVLFFLLGFAARLLRSDLRLPESLYEALAFYLLLAIGLKGGVEIASHASAGLLPQAAGALAGAWLGFSVGGAAIVATLAASASYIAAPAAMRVAIPEANPGLSLTAALGVTFPFNITLGIPLYHRFAQGTAG